MARHRRRQDHSFLEQLEPRQLLTSIMWDGGGDGTTLTQPANWVGDVLPGAADDAAIGAGPTVGMSSGALSVHSLTCAAPLSIAGGTLTLAAASGISAAFAMSGGTINGAGDLTLSITFNWTGGTIGGMGTLTLGASSTSTFGGFTKGANRNIVNNGTINWTDGNIGGFSGPAITFTNNGTFNAVPGGGSYMSANTAPNTFINHGTITKSGAALAVIDGFVLNSTGPITVSGGTLTLAGGGSQSGLTTVNPGGTMNQGVGTFTYTATATFAGTGAWMFSNGNGSFDAAFSPAGAVSIPYGTLTLNAPSNSIATLAMSGGAISGAGNLTITSTLNWSGGRIGGTGLLTIAPAATVNCTAGSLGTNRDITNAGTFNWVHSSLGECRARGSRSRTTGR
jgi:hypothetical protein